MSIFGDLDLESAADDPFAVEDGTYNATVTKCEVKNSKNDTKGLALTYTITDDGPMQGRNASEWKNIPVPADPQNPTAEEQQAASFLKQRILSLGIPKERVNSFTPEDAIGVDVVITVKNTTAKDGNTYANVQKVALATVGGSNADSGNAFASL